MRSRSERWPKGPRRHLRKLSTMLILGLPAALGSAQFRPPLESFQTGAWLDRCGTIFVGRLQSKHSSQSGGVIVTRHRFLVERHLRGPRASHIEVVEYGGTLDGLTLSLSHNVHYHEGASYLVFAYRDELGWTRTMGGSLGRLPLIDTADGSRLLRVHPDHPVRSLLPFDSLSILQDLEVFCRRLTNRLKQHEAR